MNNTINKVEISSEFASKIMCILEGYNLIENYEVEEDDVISYKEEFQPLFDSIYDEIYDELGQLGFEHENK